MWALKVDINLLKQHCKSTDWLADWLTDWLRHLSTQGTQGTWVLKHLRHSKRTWVLQALERYVGTPTLRTLGTLGHSKSPRALGHSKSPRALGHPKSTWKLAHSGTRAPEALETLYLANSSSAYKNRRKTAHVSYRVHTKTTDNLKWVGTSWNQLEQGRTTWNELEPPGTR